MVRANGAGKWCGQRANQGVRSKEFGATMRKRIVLVALLPIGLVLVAVPSVASSDIQSQEVPAVPTSSTEEEWVPPDPSEIPPVTDAQEPGSLNPAEVPGSVTMTTAELAAPLSAAEIQTRRTFGLRIDVDPSVFGKDPESARRGMALVAIRTSGEEADQIERALGTQDELAVVVESAGTREWYGGAEIRLDDAARGDVALTIFATDAAAARRHLGDRADLDVVERPGTVEELETIAETALANGAESTSIDQRNGTLLIASSDIEGFTRERGPMSIVDGVRNDTGVPASRLVLVDFVEGQDEDCRLNACEQHLQAGLGFQERANPTMTTGGMCSLAFPIRTSAFDARYPTADHCDDNQPIWMGHEPTTNQHNGTWGPEAWTTSWMTRPQAISNYDVALIPWPHWLTTNRAYRCSAEPKFTIERSEPAGAPAAGTWVRVMGSRSHWCRGAEFDRIGSWGNDANAMAIFDRDVTIGGDSGGLWSYRIGSQDAAFAIHRGDIGGVDPNDYDFDGDINEVSEATRYRPILDGLGATLRLNAPAQNLIANREFRNSLQGWSFSGSSGARWPNDGYAATDALSLTGCATSCSIYQDLSLTVQASDWLGVGAWVECLTPVPCTVTLAIWGGLSEVQFGQTTIPANGAAFVNITKSFGSTWTGVRYEIYYNGSTGSIRLSDPFLTVF